MEEINIELSETAMSVLLSLIIGMMEGNGTDNSNPEAA